MTQFILDTDIAVDIANHFEGLNPGHVCQVIVLVKFCCAKKPFISATVPPEETVEMFESVCDDIVRRDITTVMKGG